MCRVIEQRKNMVRAKKPCRGPYQHTYEIVNMESS